MVYKAKHELYLPEIATRFLTVPWLGLQCVIVEFLDHTHLFLKGESPYWKGVNQQSSLEALVKVLCWSPESVPQTCYQVSDLTFVTGSNNGKYCRANQE